MGCVLVTRQLMDPVVWVLLLAHLSRKAKVNRRNGPAKA